MTSIKKAQPGDLLYFTPEELTILVVMAGDDGIRYIEPMNLEFDNNGNFITNYVSYSALSEWTVLLGSIADISTSLMGKQS
jgi:hypothetical protein